MVYFPLIDYLMKLVMIYNHELLELLFVCWLVFEQFLDEARKMMILLVKKRLEDERNLEEK